MPPKTERKYDSRGRYVTHPDCKHSTGRSRKRRKRFGNRPKKNSDASTSETNVQNQSTSSPQSDTTNRIIDISILFPELENALCCSKCHGRIHISESSTQGLGFQINVECEKCGHVAAINSCKKVGQMNNAWETNSRSVLAMRVLGHGHTDLLTFCGIMDLPNPVEPSAFTAINDHLSKVCEETDQGTGNVAVKEEVDSPRPSPPSSPQQPTCEMFEIFQEKCEAVDFKLENDDDYDS